MPHIIIKTIEGKSPELLAMAAKAAADAVAAVLDKPERAFSVAVEEYTFAQWPAVYDQHIRDRQDVLVKPGYSCPVTFE